MLLLDITSTGTLTIVGIAFADGMSSVLISDARRNKAPFALLLAHPAISAQMHVCTNKLIMLLRCFPLAAAGLES